MRVINPATPVNSEQAPRGICRGVYLTHSSSLSPPPPASTDPQHSQGELQSTAGAFYFHNSMVFFNKLLLLRLVKLEFIKKSIKKGIFSCQ